MVRKQVKSLYKLSVEVTKENMNRLLTHHCTSCEHCSSFNTELCSSFKTARDEFQMLPQRILQDIYDDIMDSGWNFSEATKDLPKQYLITSLLYFQSLRIMKNDMSAFEYNASFFTKFGKNLKSLSLNRLRFATWQKMLFSANNITILDLGFASHVDDRIMELIGKQCCQLKEIKNFLLSVNITHESIEKLCFLDYPQNTLRNKCCENLQTIELYFCNRPTVKVYNARICKIVSTLLQNVTNLINLGKKFYADIYLRCAYNTSDSIPQTNLQSISVNHLSKNLILLLRLFCPRLKNLLKVKIVEFGVTDCLQALNFVNQFESINYREKLSLQCYEEFIYVNWCALKELYVTFTVDIELSDLAEKLPSLEKLHAGTKKKLTWNGETYFNTLHSFQLMLLFTPADSCWFASFAKTIKSINIVYYPDSVNTSAFEILLTMAFPMLEVFDVRRLNYDFHFVSNVIMLCPKLRLFKLVNATTIEVHQLTDVLRENNLECKF